jgi:hypothetical protein
VKKGILKTLGVAVVLALLLAAFPASVASAAASVYMKNDNTASDYFGEAKGSPGDKIIIGGSGVTVGNDYAIYFSSQNADIADEIGDEVTIYKKLTNVIGLTGGVFYADSTALKVPTTLNDNIDLHGGTYYVYVVDAADTDKNIIASAEFEIVDVAEAEIDVEEGPVGTIVYITGSGFAPEEDLQIKFGSTDITDLVDDPVTDEEGKFEISFAVPEAVNGNKDIIVKGETSLAEVKFTFKVLAKITLSVSSGEAGSTVTINGTGFARLKYVDIFIGTTKLDDNNAATRTDKTSSAGSFSTTVTIPSTLTPGTYTIKAADENTSSINDTESFNVVLNSVLAISNNSGKVDDTVTVTGTNFTPNSTLSILFDTQIVDSVTTDALGNFSKQITVPAAVCGAHLIKVGTTQQTYTVTPKMSLDKTQGIAGTTITVTGKGFAGGTPIMAKFNNGSVVITPAVTDATGGFVASFIVPTVATGTYVVSITAGNEVTTNFTIVDASMTIDINNGKVGDTISITGTNFAANHNINLTIDGSAITGIGTITTNATGGFTANFNIPAIVGGLHTLVVSDGTTSKTTTITVHASASITPTSGNVGTSVTVSGSGFNANAQLTIKYNGIVAATGTLPSNGAFANATFPIPASVSGTHAVEVTDGINTVSLTFTMESTAPAAPTLSLPLQASEEKGIITFDWSDVTDPSLPVTYTLQVATDNNFGAIVLEISGLTTSTYTLTEAQELPKLANNGLYYWRVKATDGASNTSISSVNNFTVAGGLPGWLMWVWIGIGVVVVFVLAIWLGRRMAYSAY